MSGQSDTPSGMAMAMQDAPKIGDLYARIATLERECAALRRDAERYRWLQYADNQTQPFICIRPHGVFTQVTGTVANDAIDAAMQEAK